MDQYTIYTLSGPDGGVRFVGTTSMRLQARIIRYKSAIDAKGKSPVMEWIREIGYENLVARTIETVGTKEMMKERAEHYIRTFSLGGHDLLNVTPEQHREIIRKTFENPAVREKISVANKGRVRTPETRARMSEAKRGHPISDEHKAIISKVHTGKFVAESTRKLISEKAMGHKRNEGRVQSPLTRLKMSVSKHENGHIAKGIVKDNCKWCAGLDWAEAVRELG